MQFKFRAKFFPEDVAEEIIQDITLVCNIWHVTCSELSLLELQIRSDTPLPLLIAWTSSAN